MSSWGKLRTRTEGLFPDYTFCFKLSKEKIKARLDFPNLSNIWGSFQEMLHILTDVILLLTSMLSLLPGSFFQGERWAWLAVSRSSLPSPAFAPFGQSSKLNLTWCLRWALWLSPTRREPRLCCTGSPTPLVLSHSFRWLLMGQLLGRKDYEHP